MARSKLIDYFQLRSIKGKPPSPRHNQGMASGPRPSHSTKLPSGLPLSPTSAGSPGIPTALPRRAPAGASPHSSPRHRPVPVARVSPALKPSPAERAKQGYRDLDKGSNFSGEEVKNWGEVEGTPIGCSNATSLSDLTVDTCDQETQGKLQPNSGRAESVKRYATEGTPADFSRCESLSSLSCEDDGGQVTCRLAGPDPRARQHKEQQPGAESDEVPRHFNVEDTPAALSRRSSLSSIEGVTCEATGTAKSRNQSNTNGTQNFGVEDTPVCFSRNSSLSSLSVESYPEETTPSEQALLQHCINQGMPRNEQRTSRGNASRGNKRGKSGSRIPGMSQSPARSPGRTGIPGVPMQRLQLAPATSGNTRNGGALHHEAESSKLRTDLEQTEKSQIRKPNTGSSACHLDDDSSLIDDITEVTEPMSEAVTAPIAEVAPRQISPPKSGIPSSCNSSPEDRLHSSSDDARISPGRVNGGPAVGSDVSMTDSMIVATEAMRIAQAVEVQGMEGRSSDDASLISQSINSDGLLENVVAPSVMDSVLSLSASLNDDNQRNQQRKVMECRHTRKIPAMVRRALADHDMSDVNGTNGSSLASSCHSNLENVGPPAFLEAADDMESSMISVASITSEVAESRHSPPSLNSSLPSEAMAAIEAPAQQLAQLFSREARQQMSSMTLTAGEETTSTCQEVTELDRDTLGPLDTVTDTELAIDDIPNDIPDLPQDSPVHRARNSPQVTPSMLRKAVHNDRFRTFTKTDKPYNSGDASKSGASSRQGLTPRERRAEQSERYLTRVISTEEDVDMTSPVTPTVDNPMGIPLQRRSLREKRQTNPERYQTRTIESAADPAKSQGEGIVDFRDGAELDLTSEQLEALSQDANIIICTLNENREANTADLMQGLSQENILDIETLSLISSDEDDNTFDVSAPASPAVPARPRIVKPGEGYATKEEEEEEAKGIRGKRKALYPGAGKVQATVRPSQHQTPAASSRPVATLATAFKPTPRGQTQTKTQPQQLRQQQQTQQKPQPTPAEPPGSPKLPRATRASELRQKAGRGGSSSSSPASSAGSSPRMGATPKTRQPPPQVHTTMPGLKRQNTFTKEDEEAQQLKPSASTTSGKPKYRRDVVQPSPAIGVRLMQRPSSHDGTTRAGQPKSCSLTRDARLPSANDMADWSKDSKGGKSAKKDVTSRIANLWKRVEKAQTTKPKETDGKVWISSKSKNKTPDPESPPPLLRSSTYEKLTFGEESRSDTERGDASKTKTRLGLKLSRFRGRGDSKSSPPSEVSTPVGGSGATTPRGREQVSSDGKRLSRLGSFVIVDGEEQGGASGSIRSPQSAVVSPFNYQPPESRTDERDPAASTRIPLPKSVVMSNNPRDDNGNAPYV